MKAPHQPGNVRQLLPVRRRRIGQVLPEGEILEGAVLGKDGVPAELEVPVPESSWPAVQPDAVTAEALVQAGQGFQEGGLSGPVQADQPNCLVLAKLEGKIGQHVLSLAVPGAEVLKLQDVPAHGYRSPLLFFSFFQEV